MKKVKHIIFWLVVIGIILLLFSSHVIAEQAVQLEPVAAVRAPTVFF